MNDVATWVGTASILGCIAFAAYIGVVEVGTRLHRRRAPKCLRCGKIMTSDTASICWGCSGGGVRNIKEEGFE